VTAFPLRVGVVTAQQHRTWPELVETWTLIEALGFDTAWVYDHLLPATGDPAGSCLEAWTLLAGLATRTRRARIGVLVTAATFRHPVLLAKQATTLDHLSDGRLELGLGAAWNAAEHAAYGIPFPPPAERVDRLAECLEIIRRLWTTDNATFAGRFFQLTLAPFAPRPVQRPHPPIVVAAKGRRMLAVAGRYADNWNMSGTPSDFARCGVLVSRAAVAAGRDPARIRWSVGLGSDPFESVAAFEHTVESYVAVGVRDFMLNWPGEGHLATVRDIATRSLPRLRERYAAQL
jgi:F420-dependent oxidoreductase-like protein